jgi:hypothetical protein
VHPEINIQILRILCTARRHLPDGAGGTIGLDRIISRSRGHGPGEEVMWWGFRGRREFMCLEWNLLVNWCFNWAMLGGREFGFRAGFGMGSRWRCNNDLMYHSC